MKLSQYVLAAGPASAMAEKDRLMCLEDLCLDPLQQFLESKENLVTYADYKLALHNHFVSGARWAGRSRIDWVGAQEDFGSSHALEAANLSDRDGPGEEISRQI